MQLVCSNTGTTRVRSTAEAEEKMRRAGGYVRGGHHTLNTAGHRQYYHVIDRIMMGLH